MDHQRRERAVDVCAILLAVLLPPLGVFLKRECQIEFWVCVLLTLLGYIPGIFYALYVILKVGIDKLAYNPEILCSK